ncbi:unnamed protein product [Nippostrongylus brasiliensis]|uniref:Mothers against decapentaplegic homolog n=1 Tax=Nippostrongylus brasiliensis TaxID=27835 RepID=A0A158R0R0_NIPBR|nr:unnamed protein product [Nippostrongylus brasiliensis]
MNGLFNGTSVKKLLGWRIGEEEEKFAEKAVETLVKKLKKKNGGVGTLDDLEYALAHPGSHSKCVALPKSQDGRLQVSHRKGLPHVIYCRVWRWPDLQSHQELRPIPECLYPHDHNNKTAFVCINPYHYQRIDQNRVSPYTTPPTQYWATISYYELNSRVGEYFKVYKNELIVDGFTDPNSDERICLGLLSNVNRNPTIENTRRHIGKGIGLLYTSDYDLYIRNLSESSIFVQSRNLNYNMHQEQTTVCRVPAHSEAVCVFSNIVFQQMLQNAKMRGAEELHALQKVCFIRLSFVKEENIFVGIYIFQHIDKTLPEVCFISGKDPTSIS